MLDPLRNIALVATVMVVAVFAFAASGASAASKYFAVGKALSIDPAFNGGNELPIMLPDGTAVADAQDVTTLPDGRIIVLTFKSVLAYDTSGKLDPTFGTGGEAQIDLGGKYHGFPVDKDSPPTSIRTTPDGNILIVGVRGNWTLPVLLQLKPDGSVDKSFGSRGLIVVDHALFFASGEGADVTRVAFRKDGAIVAASETNDWLGGGSVLLASVFSKRGKLQTRFGTHGVARVAYKIKYSEGDWLGGVTFDRGGRVVLAGYIGDSTGCLDPPCPGKYVGSTLPFVARLTIRGKLDRSFSSDGILTALPKGCATVAVATLPSNGLLIADACSSVTRTTTSGRIVKRFRGKAGAAKGKNFPVESGAPEAIHKNPDGSFIVADKMDLPGKDGLEAFVLRGMSSRGFDAGGTENVNLSNSASSGFRKLAFDRDNHAVTLVNRQLDALSTRYASYLARF